MAAKRMRRRIREQWETLVQDLRPVEPHCDLLFSRGSMSRETYERIICERVSFDKARRLLHYLLDADDEAIEAFIRKLTQLQPYLASRIGLTQADADAGHTQLDHECNPIEDRGSNLSDIVFVVDGAKYKDNLAEQHSSTGEVLTESGKEINQETASMKKTREDTKVKLQDCQRVLLELRGCCTDPNGKELKELKTKLCQMLDTGILEAKWIDEQTPIDNRYDNLLTDIAHVLSTSEENPAILHTFVNASAGLALKGFFHLVGSSVESKETFLSAPKKVKVTDPSTQSDCLVYVKEFTSEVDCERFLQTLDTQGYNIAGIPKVNCRASEPQSQEYETKVSKECSFYSQVFCCIRATAACSIEPNDLRFSPKVLSELKKIDRAIKNQTESEKRSKGIEKACVKLLNTFGSHVSTGLLHMGGIKRFIGTYSGRAQPLDQVKTLVKHALNGYIRMSSSGLLCSETAKASAADLETTLNIPKPYDELDLSNINLQTSNNGGPDLANLPVWKIGLSVNRNSWALIDRCSPTEYTPIWDLISIHEDFVVPMQVASHLQSSWEQAIGVQRPLATSSLLDEIESSLDSWSSDTGFLENCQARLSHLLFAIEELFRETGSYSFWEHVLSQRKTFKQFLAKVETEMHFPLESDRSIRYTLGRIRSADGEPALESDFDLKKVPGMMHKVTDVLSLVSTLKEELLPFFKSVVKRKAEHSKSTEVCIAVELAVGISHLLQSKPSTLETLLLNICLSQVRYSHKKKRFEHDITVGKLEEFCSVVEGNWKEFCAVEGTFRKESFLINLLLTSSTFQTDQTNQPRKEIEFYRMIKDARHRFSQQMRDLLETHGTSPVQWSRIISITQQIASGKVAAHRECGIETTSNPNPFEDLLEELGLSQYYPSGITWRQATAVKIFPEESERMDIPWKLLHGLLMSDHHTRDRVPSELKSQLQNDDQMSEFDLDPFSQSTSANGGETKLNPLDVLLATFFCCDGHLRQKLARSLFVCKLAIPFFYLGKISRQPTMSLWALRTIVLEWYDRQQRGQEAFATEHKLHVISFVRIGRPNASKSQIANCLVTNDSPTTFYSTERGSGTERKMVADGMVECSWFLPANNKKNRLKEPCLLLNLRGDAIVWEEQVQVLKEISAVVAVVINIEDVKGKEQESLVQLCQSVRGVVVLLTTVSLEPDKKMSSSNWGSFLSELREKDKKKIRCTSLPGGLKARQKSKICEDLSELLKGSLSLSLEEVAKVAEEHNFEIDEKEKPCIEGKELAMKVVDLIEPKDNRTEMLPLQCDTWQEYCKLERQLHQKPTPPLKKHETEMFELRRKQAGMCSKLTRVCEHFTHYLVNSRDEKASIYFLEWFGILLGRRARTILPELRKLYLNKWREFQEAKVSTIKDENLEKDLQKASKDFDDAHLGLNHFFREIGQIYEAIERAPPHDIADHPLLSQVRKAPEIFARLLLMGVPLELVDGDASNVPTTWIEAILFKLQELLSEKKLFVVTVLGVQSSGKSTLLNTMFGLQFAVSAGRCTKGVIMQVIPVHRGDLQMDYIAVLDTEGLRAPELKHVGYNHDNELATLAIGLGDVTLINVMGQNTSDIKDILQIAVHAFLRMKKVNINTHQTCMFIHQNVPSIQAKEETVQSCIALQDQLDFITKEAAHEEGFADIQAFSQIIKFNALENVRFFSGLWYGDPPMAPSNPGYSDNVRTVLESILDSAAKKETTFLTISDFGTRLRDLWLAIFADDFVFSFRNSLEIRAYNDMSKFYNMITWELTRSVMTWLQQTAHNKIKKCRTVPDLDTSVQILFTELFKTTLEKREKLERKLKQDFDGHALKAIITQWKENKLNSLTNNAEELLIEGKKYLHEVEEAHKIEILTNSKLTRLETNVMKKAVELATKLDGKLVRDCELEKQFGETWVSMKSSLTSEDQQPTKIDMESLTQKVLFDNFRASWQIVQEELTNQTFKTCSEGSSLEVPVEEGDMTKTYLRPNTSSSHGSIKQEAIRQTGEVLKRIEVRLKQLTSNGDIKFQKAHFDDVIKLLKDHFEKWNNGEGKQSFTFSATYVVRLAVYVGRYCQSVFGQMQEEYESRHGVSAKLGILRTSAYNLFQNTLKHSTEEVIAADLLCDKLKPIVKEKVAAAIPLIVTDEVLRDFSASKHHLIVQMMDDLAEMKEFKEFKFYLNSPSEFAYEWITKYTNKKMFSRAKGVISRYEELVKVQAEGLVTSIEEAAQQATDDVSSITDKKEHEWVCAFCKHVENSLPVADSDLESIRQRQIQDFNNFLKTLKDKLQGARIELLHSFARHSGDQKWAGTPPYKLLKDKLWGCEELCPFCGEPCDNTAPNHPERSHHCIQHRPTGVKEFRWKKDDEFEGLSCEKDRIITQTCNYWTQCDGMKFSCKGCSQCEKPIEEYHLYKEYKTFFPQWDIAPDPTNSVSKYWMWFMATHREDLAKMYSTLPPDVPKEWCKITKEDALGDLRKYRK